MASADLESVEMNVFEDKLLFKESLIRCCFQTIGFSLMLSVGGHGESDENTANKRMNEH